MPKTYLLPIMDIKKVFLKILYNEPTIGNKLSYQMILIKKVPEFLSRKPFNYTEFKIIKHVIKELERDGYIELIPNTRNKYRLSRKGINEAQKNIKDMKLPFFGLSYLCLRPKLYLKIAKNYKDGDFETVIFKAFKMLEIEVRSKANLPSTDNVARLMSDAFKSDGGLLKYPYAETDGEQNGIQNLMRGAIMFFKSPRSHKWVILEDPNRVMFILAFANLLLDILDDCELVDSNKKSLI